MVALDLKIHRGTERDKGKRVATDIPLPTRLIFIENNISAGKFVIPGS
jgi:hypothetical protein